MEIEANLPSSNRLADASLGSKALNVNAAVGNEAEHSFGVIQGFKTYKRAAFWSIGTRFFHTYLRRSGGSSLTPAQPSRPPSSWRDTM